MAERTRGRVAAVSAGFILKLTSHFAESIKQFKIADARESPLMSLFNISRVNGIEEISV